MMDDHNFMRGLVNAFLGGMVLWVLIGTIIALWWVS
jgi:hypothetical protein